MHPDSVTHLLQKDNNNLDLVRIICASMVIIGHSYVMDPHPGMIDIVRLGTGGFTYSSALAVKVFFFISGMLVTDSLLKRKSIPVFIISRLFRLVPALLLLVLITSFVIGPFVTQVSLKEYFADSEVYRYVYSNCVFLTAQFLPGVFLEHPWRGYVNASLWTLRIEVKCYFMLVASYLFIGPRRMLYNLIILLVFIDALFYLHYIGITNESELSLLPFSFALGMLLAVNKDHIVVNNKVLLASLVVTILTWRVYHINEMALITLVCISIIQFSKNKYVRQIKIKHDISYGIYLWGFIVQQTIYHFAGTQNLYLYMLECLVVSSICGYVSFVLVEKKAMNLGKTLGRKMNIQSTGLLSLFIKTT